MEITPGALTLEQLQAIGAAVQPLAIASAARERVRASAALVQRAAAGAAPVYGVNTGFGKLASRRIEADLGELPADLGRLQDLLHLGLQLVDDRPRRARRREQREPRHRLEAGQALLGDRRHLG